MLVCVLARSDTVGYMLHVGFNSFTLNWHFGSRLFLCEFAEGLLAPRDRRITKSSVEQVTYGSFQSNKSHNGLKSADNPTAKPPRVV